LKENIIGHTEKYPLVLTTYHDNGKLISNRPIIDTLKHGEEIFYNNNNDIVFSRRYKYGHLIGEDLKSEETKLITPYVELKNKIL